MSRQPMGLRRGADQPRFVPAYGDTLPAGVLAFLGSMDVREVIEGLALSAWGVGGLYLANRYRIRDEWRERVGRSRWGWDKRTSRRAREMGEAQWVQRYSESQRRMVTWIGIPFVCLWTALALTLLIRGLAT